MKKQWTSLILLITVINAPIYGEDCTPLAAQLTLCNQYVRALEEHEKTLKEKVDLLNTEKNQLVKELQKAEEPPLVPTWVIVISSAALGAAVYGLLRR